MSEYPLSGKTIVVTGTLKTMNRREATSALSALGAYVTNSISGNTDALVAGEKAGRKMEKARRANVPILGEEQLQELLKGLSLEEILQGTEEEEVETQPLEDTFALFREALSLGPTCSAWEQIIALLDKTSEEQLPLVVEYLLSHTAEWDELEHESWYWSPFVHQDDEITSPFWREHPFSGWREGIEAGEVRTAPYPWVEQMMRGVDSPKWLLVRQVHLNRLGLNGKQGVMVIELPSLRNLEILNITGNKKLSATFYKKLRQTDGMSRLKSIRFGSLDEKKAAALHGDCVFQLERLGLDDSGGVSSLAFDKLLSAECMQNVHSLEMLSVSYPDRLAEALQKNEALLPELRHLQHLFFYPTESIRDWSASGLLQRLESFRFGMVHHYGDNLATLLTTEHFPNLKTLHVSDIAISNHDDELEIFQQLLQEALENSGLVSQLDSIFLGEMHSDSLQTWFQSNGVEVTG
jgi:hypothetical protein